MHQSSSAWMKFAVHFLQAALIHMGIYLRRADIGMAEHFLDDPQIGSTTEQMCREAVPQLMRMDGTGKARTFCAFTHNLPYT